MNPYLCFPEERTRADKLGNSLKLCVITNVWSKAFNLSTAVSMTQLLWLLWGAVRFFFLSLQNMHTLHDLKWYRTRAVCSMGFRKGVITWFPSCSKLPDVTWPQGNQLRATNHLTRPPTKIKIIYLPRNFEMSSGLELEISQKPFCSHHK